MCIGEEMFNEDDLDKFESLSKEQFMYFMRTCLA